jgi:hypothetical protein
VQRTLKCAAVEGEKLHQHIESGASLTSQAIPLARPMRLCCPCIENSWEIPAGLELAQQIDLAFGQISARQTITVDLLSMVPARVYSDRGGHSKPSRTGPYPLVSGDAVNLIRGETVERC